jgi:hypothetical protein
MDMVKSFGNRSEARATIPGLAAPSGFNEFATGIGRPQTGANDLRLAEWETEDEALEHLAEVSREIFKEQLNGWYREPSVWPEDRELNAFLRWFDCSFHSMVFDVCDERLRHTNT